MTDWIKPLKVLADPTRLRLYCLLDGEELSVHEIRQITRLGQSRISTHLRVLEESGLIRHRQEGKQRFYKAVPLEDELAPLRTYALRAGKELPEYEVDRENLRRVLAMRKDPTQAYFQRVAGRFGRTYGPGRSWQALAQALLRMLPPLVVADLGAGEGLISEMLALRCRKVIAVDNSPRMVAYGRRKAKRNRISNLEFRLGDLEDPPIAPEEVDVVLLSQALHHAVHPARALQNAFRILKPGGQVVILDLLRHSFVQAQELYGDLWLGFTEGELHQWLTQAGFIEIEIQRVAREEQPPHFETLLAVGRKPEKRSFES